MASSPVDSASSRPRASRSSAASAARVNPGWAAARAAVMASASGSRAHSPISSPAACGSSATRPGPSRAASICRASSVVSTSRLICAAPSVTTRLASSARLVIRTWASGGAGQQRADLGGVAGVVEQDEDLLAVQQAAVQGVAAVQAGRYLGGRDLQGIQERAQCFGRGKRVAGAEAAQVHVQLAVGEPGGGLAGPVHGQRGLADPGGAADRGDHHRAAVPSRHCGQRGQFRGPAGEVRHRRRQQARPDRARRRATVAPGRRRCP